MPLLGLMFVVLLVAIDSLIGRGMTLVLYPLFFWGGAALSVKRLHDRNGSPFWLVLLPYPRSVQFGI